MQILSVRALLFSLAVTCLALPSVSQGANRHPLSKVEGTFYVSPKRVTARLKLFVEDLYLFHEMEPDDQDRLYAKDLEPARLAHRDFLVERVRILDVDGKELKCRVIDVSPLGVPEEGWSTDELMEHTLVYDLEYDLEERPEYLTIVQDIVDANFVFPSELELLLRQEGSSEAIPKILRPGDPFTVRFDWDRDDLDADASQAALDEWLNQEREETLGITSYDSVYSFLYITRREVRHEILIPLGTLAAIFEIPRSDPNFLKVDEQDDARVLIEQYFSEGNPVSIDGVEVPPIAERIDFYGLSLKDFAQQAEARDVSMASGRVGVILVYPCKEEPAEVQLTWTKFTSDVRKVNTVVFAMDTTGKAEFSRFQSENTFTWTNPNEIEPRGARPIIAGIPEPTRWPLLSLTLVVGWIALLIIPELRRRRKLVLVTGGIVFPVATCLCFVPSMWVVPPGVAGATLPPDEQSSVARTLLANVYRAFDYYDEADIYDSLAESVQGDLLSDLYLEIREGLEIKEQGGAVATVQDVEILEIEGDQSSTKFETKPPGFIVTCRWNVEGTVEHWGHIHRRVNQYAANFAVQPDDGSWRLVGIDLTEEKRLKNKRELRRF